MSINWDKFVADEDRIIANSDRKQRDHFISFEAMSEELVYQKKSYEIDWDNLCEPETDFIDTIKNQKLKSAIERLTTNQKQVIELYFWNGYNQSEIAEIMHCSQKNISELISNAKIKIQKYLTD